MHCLEDDLDGPWWVSEAREAPEWRARTSYARLHVGREDVGHTTRMWYLLSRKVVSRCGGVKLHVGGKLCPFGKRRSTPPKLLGSRARHLFLTRQSPYSFESLIF